MTFPNAEVQKIRDAIDCLTVYREVFEDPVLVLFREILELTLDGDPKAVRNFYSFYGMLLGLDRNKSLPGVNIFKDHLLNVLLGSENIFSWAAEKGKPGGGLPDCLLVRAVKNDLRLLKIICDFDLTSLAKLLEDEHGLSGIAPEPGSLGDTDSSAGPAGDAPQLDELYPQYYFQARAQIKQTLAASANWVCYTGELQAFYRKTGSGRFGRYWAFRWHSRGTGSGSDSGLVGIAKPDQIRMEDLVGYDDQKQQILLNTEQFVHGYSANNVLLYGDRGTGKSSTIKSLIHRFGPQGLRIIEITKHDLHFLHQVADLISNRAQKFIIFIDDLSFEEDETEYKELKALLEGSIEKPPENVLVYATSNRRNLVREYFSDRQSDEVGKQDTYQEKLSLADRFGIKLVYSVPNQDQYLKTVEEIAEKCGIAMNQGQLHELALRWALWHNARSGRTARQFVNDLKGRLLSRNI